LIFGSSHSDFWVNKASLIDLPGSDLYGETFQYQTTGGEKMAIDLFCQIILVLSELLDQA